MRLIIPNRRAMCIIGGLLLLLGSSACAASGPVQTVTPSVLARLTPYLTATSSPSPSATAPAPSRQPPTIPPPPSPTPFLYEVKKGDTMGTIAFQHGVTVDDLRTANPDVEPNLMSVGMKLVIPISAGQGGTPTTIPTPTPVAVKVGPAACFPAAGGGLWCLASVENELKRPVENVSAWISLFGEGESAAGGQEAILPLNLLPPGEKLPLSVLFPSAAPGASAQVELLTALELPRGDKRYLPAELDIESTRIDPQGRQATLTGTIRLPAGSQEAKVVWVAAIAYGEDGRPVGVRKWEAPRGLPPGGNQEIEITVYSLGPPISEVDALVEARP